MSLDYIRKTYGVTVKRVQRVRFAFGDVPKWGTVAGATHYLRVRFDGDNFSQSVHPTDPALTYITTDQPK